MGQRENAEGARRNVRARGEADPIPNGPEKQKAQPVKAGLFCILAPRP